MQLVLRNIPSDLAHRLDERAREVGKSVDGFAVELLERALTKSVSKKRDLSDVVGWLSAEDARALEESVAALDAADLAGQEEKEDDAIRYRHEQDERSATRGPERS